jgi:ribose transport system ATP-binding protein
LQADLPQIDLTLQGIGKVYPGIVALRDVTLSIKGGEILGIIGENGAGKSTLMKILGGTIRPDAGRILLDGEPVAGLTPAAATAAGIAFVHQELNTLSNLDVAGNVLLGHEIAKGWLRVLDHAAMARRVQPVLDLLGARFGPTDQVADLSLADRQFVEIARALSLRARLVILDEPTSSLTQSETARLLDVMRGLSAKGVAVVFISHRLREVEEVCDRVVVLRDGQVVGELTGAGIGRDRMVSLMIGRDLSRTHGLAGRPTATAALELRGVRTTTHPHAPVDLSVWGGEILGLAGLVGAGRSELARAIFGVDRAHGGQVIVGGDTIKLGSVPAALALGLCLVPEDRKQQGLFLDFSVSDNLVLPSLRRLTPGLFLDSPRIDGLARDLRDRLAIKVAGIGQAAAELSGGNQQKVVLAKWLAMNPRVIILDEPTRGIDIGAKAEVYALMRALADEGVGILMISSDMEEIVGVSHRVAVMANGVITGILAGEEITEEAILRLAVH